MLPAEHTGATNLMSVLFSNNGVNELLSLQSLHNVREIRARWDGWMARRTRAACDRVPEALGRPSLALFRGKRAYAQQRSLFVRISIWSLFV